MNLYDIVKRKDRCFELVAGTVTPVRYDRPHWYYGIRLEPGTHLRLKRADEFVALATFPRDLGWSFVRTGRFTSPSVDIVIRSVDGSRSTSLLSKSDAASILLTWPHWAGESPEFDMDIINRGRASIEIKSGVVFDPRLEVRDLLQGNGIEVGPGANPCVKPSQSVDVRYVEALPIEEWLKNYRKDTEKTTKSEQDWSRYIIGDAQQLDVCDDHSLDFIFSNHVFEHLMNPLGVLERWSRKLKSSGVVVGVVPDLRYCFDLRQPPSRPDDWTTEYQAGTWNLTRQKYEKWCRYTAPYNTPEDLIARNYSIHAHYYTTTGFRELAKMAIERDFFSRVFLNTSPNNKDFGWVLWKGGAAA
jgi:SAM-dependent methyltransferase